MRRDDPILWILRWLQDHCPQVTPDLTARCERAARLEWGGLRVPYIAKGCAADTREKLVRALQLVDEGQGVSEAARRAGVGRSTVYAELLAQRGESSARVATIGDGSISLQASRRFGQGGTK